jgi:hypothetical protein
MAHCKAKFNNPVHYNYSGYGLQLMCHQERPQLAEADSYILRQLVAWERYQLGTQVDSMIPTTSYILTCHRLTNYSLERQEDGSSFWDRRNQKRQLDRLPNLRIPQLDVDRPKGDPESLKQKETGTCGALTKERMEDESSGLVWLVSGIRHSNIRYLNSDLNGWIVPHTNLPIPAEVKPTSTKTRRRYLSSIPIASGNTSVYKPIITSIESVMATGKESGLATTHAIVTSRDAFQLTNNAEKV